MAELDEEAAVDADQQVSHDTRTPLLRDPPPPPGYVDPIDGSDLLEHLVAQAENLSEEGGDPQVRSDVPRERPV